MEENALLLVSLAGASEISSKNSLPSIASSPELFHVEDPITGHGLPHSSSYPYPLLPIGRAFPPILCCGTVTSASQTDNAYEHSEEEPKTKDKTISDGPDNWNVKEFIKSIKKNNRNKRRLRTTTEQLKILEDIYEYEKIPSLSLREELASKLGMSPRRIQVWFQNKRAKDKRMGKVISEDV